MTSIEERRGVTVTSFFSRFNVKLSSGIKRMEIARMAKNIAAMLTAGLSLARALSIIERQSNNKYLRNIIAKLSDSIKQGSSFHEALAVHSHVFPEIFVAMVRAGEESGALSDSLQVVALQMERSDELIRKIRGAMIYPAIVIVAVIIVAILMLVYIVPTLTKTFASFGVKLPLSTKVILALSGFMVNNAGLVVLMGIAFILASIIFIKSKFGGRIILRAMLYVPVINVLIRETYSARAARTLSSLLTAGVPLLEALSIAKEVVHAPIFAEVIEEAENRVKKGELLSTAFANHTSLYPILMSDMLAVGEETGKVAEMLRQIAEFYESDVAEKTKDLSTIVEPLLMLFVGAVVGIFAVSMIAPIYSLSSAI